MSPDDGINPTKWIQEDLDAEEEAIRFLQTQTKLVERLKKELREQGIEMERLRAQLGKQDEERAEVAALYDELRDLERRYRRREEDQARKEGEAAARQEHLESLQAEQRVLLETLERDLEHSEKRNLLLEDDLTTARQQMADSEARVVAVETQQRAQIASLESENERLRLELNTQTSRLDSLRPTFEEETRRLREALDEARRDADAKLFDLSRAEEKAALAQQARSELEQRFVGLSQKVRDSKENVDIRRQQVASAEVQVRVAQESAARMKVELDGAQHREGLLRRQHEQRELRMQEETDRWKEKCSQLEADLLTCWQEVKRAQEEELESRRVHEALSQRRLDALHRRHAAQARLRDALVDVVEETSSPKRETVVSVTTLKGQHVTTVHQQPLLLQRSPSFEETLEAARNSPPRGAYEREVKQKLDMLNSVSRRPLSPSRMAAVNSPSATHLGFSQRPISSGQLHQITATMVLPSAIRHVQSLPDEEEEAATVSLPASSTPQSRASQRLGQTVIPSIQRPASGPSQRHSQSSSQQRFEPPQSVFNALAKQQPAVLVQHSEEVTSRHSSQKPAVMNVSSHANSIASLQNTPSIQFSHAPSHVSEHDRSHRSVIPQQILQSPVEDTVSHRGSEKVTLRASLVGSAANSQAGSLHTSQVQ